MPYGPGGLRARGWSRAGRPPGDRMPQGCRRTSSGWRRCRPPPALSGAGSAAGNEAAWVGTERRSAAARARWWRGRRAGGLAAVAGDAGSPRVPCAPARLNGQAAQAARSARRRRATGRHPAMRGPLPVVGWLLPARLERISVCSRACAPRRSRISLVIRCNSSVSRRVSTRSCSARSRRRCGPGRQRTRGPSSRARSAWAAGRRLRIWP